MEGLHGLDISWVHSNREHHRSSPLSKQTPPRSSGNGLPVQPVSTPNASDKSFTPASESKMSASATQASVSNIPPKLGSKRPGVLARMPSDKSTSTISTTSSDGTGRSALRRGSWIKNLKDQFGSSPQNAQTSSPAVTAKTTQNGVHASGAPNGQAPAASSRGEGAALKNQQPLEEVEQEYSPQQSKSGGFLSSAFRRLSSSSQVTQSGGAGKVQGSGGLCPRRVMNVDANRERCQLRELDPSRLRKVAFCVDVEIVGGPRYKDDTDPDQKRAKSKENRLKEKGEGAALKNRQAMAEEKDKSGIDQADALAAKEASIADAAKADEAKSNDTDNKQRTAEERQERAERKRRKAEENGSLPKEFVRDSDGTPLSPTSTGPTPKPQNRPTIDPVRIYRRCCQLRETPILKRITEQLTQPSACPANTPGVVTCLNLTGSRLQLPDVVALSDWLAIVPVKKLLFEDADLTDEGVRVVLAGLLAAKPPERQRPRRRKAQSSPGEVDLQKESLGMIEKLSLKNNRKLTAEAWRYISLFVYMCRSVKAIDLSMNTFPNGAPVAASKAGRQQNNNTNVTDIFSKSIASRLAGDHLEELMMAECHLDPSSVHRIVDAVGTCGIARLGLAGNNLDDEGFQAVLRYIGSDICSGLDLGGNDLHSRIEDLAQAFKVTSPIWALSLADCNLTPDSLKPLFPALQKLPNFRFIDLSHNHDLFGQRPDLLPLLRKWIPQMHMLKRIHLLDTSIEPRQLIGLAEVIPESEHLAHLNVLENPALTRLASATSEEDQEEACAVYASLMAAARMSNAIIAIDIDVPTPESSDLVKSLARQVVAYCLRNMERWAAMEAPGGAESAANAPESDSSKEVEVPDVLLHLVGHLEGAGDEEHDSEVPAPDDDYIVGGTGVCKILNYCLGEKANETKRDSMQGKISSRHISGADAEARAGKTKKLSMVMLNNAKRIRTRLQPALGHASKAGDEMAFRRLQFLDSTLQNVITRFEDEYPEAAQQASNGASGRTSTYTPSPLASSIANAASADPGILAKEGDLAIAEDTDDDEFPSNYGRRERQGSQVSLVGKRMGLEEGRMHKLGAHLRRDIMRSASVDDLASEANGTPLPRPDGKDSADITELKHKLDTLQGAELREHVKEVGFEELLKKLGGNVDDLRRLRKIAEQGDLGPEEQADWNRFREAQESALINASRNGDKGENALSD